MRKERLNMSDKNKKDAKEKIPVIKAEDVEFSRELADRDDFEAIKRARRADRRQEKR
jgi:hypothetical protein